MTYPEIGNYGINIEDYESERIHAAGFVVKRLSPLASSWRSELSLQEFLTRNEVVGIEGVDTRAITRKIRAHGVMKAGITTEKIAAETFLSQIKAQPTLDEQKLVDIVTTRETYTLRGIDNAEIECIVVVDFGIKTSILDALQELVQEIIVVPADVSFETIAGYTPQGVLLSNGPGDPTTLAGPVAMAKALVQSGIPTFGICLGHQILALACGAKVSKMPFGHHGGNHPVLDVASGTITITSQNHGYAADFEAFPTETLQITHVNLNDQTIEGFSHLQAPVSSVQFHPEASPGPHDARYLFARFIEQARTHQPTATSA